MPLASTEKVEDYNVNDRRSQLRRIVLTLLADLSKLHSIDVVMVEKEVPLVGASRLWSTSVDLSITIPFNKVPEFDKTLINDISFYGLLSEYSLLLQNKPVSNTINVTLTCTPQGVVMVALHTEGEGRTKPLIVVPLHLRMKKYSQTEGDITNKIAEFIMQFVKDSYNMVVDDNTQDDFTNVNLVCTQYILGTTQLTDMLTLLEVEENSFIVTARSGSDYHTYSAELSGTIADRLNTIRSTLHLA